MTTPSADRPTDSARLTRHLARTVLASFLFTFAASRIMVLLIMSHRVPDFYLHLGHTHVHHLNYGIFILSFIGYYLIFMRPMGRALMFAAIIYGIGLGLTFDEFGMWIHLGGGYWQRMSFDAVVVIGALLALIAYAPELKRLRPHHWITAVAMALVLTVLGVLLVQSTHHIENRIGPTLEEIERTGPS